MALQKVGEKALAIGKGNDNTNQFKIPAIPEKKVLKEEDYTKDLEKIIVRDFYPDLPRLQAQTEYLDALQRNDLVKLREIQIKYGPKRPNTNSPSLYNTPATFETPEARPGSSPTSQQEGHTEDKDEPPTHNPELVKKPTKSDDDLGLDSYLSKTTSEDNASFNEILHETQKKRELKYAWLYEQEQSRQEDQDAALALPSIEKQAAIEGPRTQQLQTWKYTAKNALMYVPQGASHTTEELIEKKSKPREILHINTRFKNDPFNPKASQSQIQQAAQQQQQNLVGKIGVDGREVMPQETPKVGGYGMLATPSPAPGVDESPLMTWGEIEGTPFRLDGGGTPAMQTPGPTFKMPEVTRREELAMELAENASKAHRAKKESALKHVTRLATPSVKFGSLSRTDRLNSMSPAAQRLASTKLGIRTHTDKALRASYTPSPARAANTPTPKLTTPKSVRATPTPGSATPKPISKRSNPQDASSLTDNLLQLPKRPRAEDFF